jgi:hypothetical protein
MSQQTSINGDRYSFVNLAVELDGNLIAKGVFTSINYDATQEPGVVQGNQVTIVGRTAGYGTATGSFEMLVSEWDDFNAFLTQDGLFPTMSVYFDIIVSYSVNDIDVRTDTLRGVKITKIGSANQQGTDPTKKTCDLSIARLLLDGIEAFGDPAA